MALLAGIYSLVNWNCANCATFRQFPQSMLTASETTSSQRKVSAQQHISCLDIGAVDMSKADYVAHYDPLVHVFTHLKLSMHAYHYRVMADKTEDVALACKGPPARRWVDSETMDNETLSTGMRKCWEVIRKAQ